MTKYNHHCCCHHCKYLLFHQGFTFPVDCKVGDWKRWGKCSATCGGGTKTSERDVIKEPENGGAACPHLEETETCNTDQCEGTLNPILCASIISHILFFGYSLFSSSKVISETQSSRNMITQVKCLRETGTIAITVTIQSTLLQAVHTLAISIHLQKLYVQSSQLECLAYS